MPPVEEFDDDTAILVWVPKSRDEFNKMIYSAPVERYVRWVENRRYVQGPDGKPLTVDVQLGASCPIADESLVWKGTRKELNYVKTAFPTTGVYVVTSLKQAKSVDGKMDRWEGGAMRYQTSGISIDVT